MAARKSLPRPLSVGSGHGQEVFADEIVEIFQLGECGGAYSPALCRHSSAFELGIKQPDQYGGVGEVVGRCVPEGVGK